MIKSASRSSYVRFAVVLLVVVAGFGIRIASNAHSLFGHDKKGGESDSAFHQQNFAKALDALRGKVGADGRVLEIRVEPGKVKFTVQTGADSAHGYAWDGDSLDDLHGAARRLGHARGAGDPAVDRSTPPSPSGSRRRRPSATAARSTTSTTSRSTATSRPASRSGRSTSTGTAPARSTSATSTAATCARRATRS